MNNNRKTNSPTHDVVVDNGGRFKGRDGRMHVSYEKVGIAWSDEKGIASVKLPFPGVTLYFRERKPQDEPAAGGAEEGQE